MNDINKHNWSNKWRKRLVISSLVSVTILAPFALIGYDRYGFYGALPIVILYLVYTIPMNRYISKKNQEAVNKGK